MLILVAVEQVKCHTLLAEGTDGGKPLKCGRDVGVEGTASCGWRRGGADEQRRLR